MERALPERVYAQVMMIDPQRADRQLPYWARRANPIVRDQLGTFWKVMTPDLVLPLRLYVYQVALILVTFVVPGLFNLLLPIVAVPVVLLPVALYFYVETLLKIGAEAAGTVADDQRDERFTLLRMIPMPLLHILGAKGAAAIWRQVETLELLLFAASLMSLPVVILQHANLYPPVIYPTTARLLMIAGFAASLVRLLVEPIMIAALGVLMGAVTRARIPAVLATGALGGAYLVMINLPRLLILDPAMRVVIEIILPIALPPLIAYGALHLAARRIASD